MTANCSEGAYDVGFAVDNVYGHALNLLRRYKSVRKPGEIHLDIGCGYGRIAEKLQHELGRTYVGVDGSPDGLASLSQRNFEARELRLEGRAESSRRLEEMIAGRAVGSISILDTIGHFADPDEILLAIAGIARQHLAPVVISVPNITHRDVGVKLLFGRWNSTPRGLLDHTPVRFFDQPTLTATLESAGLRPVDRDDVVLAESDQHFPSTHPALAAGTPLNALLFETARRANPCSEVNQFVWLCTPSSLRDRAIVTTIREEARPFASVVIRTQGRRPHTLTEALTCLSGQTDPDFEVIVVGHKLDTDQCTSVEREIADTPEWLREKIRLVRADDGGRSRPLNVGFAAARGRYIAILDDDDIPFGNWIEEYRKLDAQSPGRVLRATSVRQDVENVEIGRRIGLRAEGPPQRVYPSEFDFLAHLSENHSPNNTLAFPRGAFHDLGLRFDESLDTCEDWDFLLQASAYCGVASSPEITGVYRWWIDHESSRTEHSEQEWRANRDAILLKQDKGVFIVPKGCLQNIRQLDRLRAEIDLQSIGPLASVAPLRPHLLSAHNAKAQFIAFGPPAAKLNDIDDAVHWAKVLANVLPSDLACVTTKGIKRKYIRLRVKYFLFIFSARKRRQIRARLRIYRCFLHEMGQRSGW